ncbi:hypothetical protein MKK55_04685 [Methylobacterium sp. J-059]|uniref:hypothetical protein n=1 Tax=Methylobacterium sp. J-059 TaxID=2836643 RepID=UPI001FBA57C7|nr:hypothetical protein [Methylobacterium sp. J-059]MCJ2038255.1 hypothetical protein [Methylobacterium sp. J-059]
MFAVPEETLHLNGQIQLLLRADYFAFDDRRVMMLHDGCTKAIKEETMNASSMITLR